MLMVCHVAEDEWAFDLLYCVAFVVMDKQWLEKNATYMEFNASTPNPQVISLGSQLHSFVFFHLI